MPPPFCLDPQLLHSAIPHSSFHRAQRSPGTWWACTAGGRAHLHHHAPIALKPAEEVVGGEVVVGAQLAQELFGHLVDLIAEDALLLRGVPAANAGERRLPGTVEGLRRTVGPQIAADERVQTCEREVGAPWTHVQPACHALLGELAMLPALPQTRVCGDETYVRGMASARF